MAGGRSTPGIELTRGPLREGEVVLLRRREGESHLVRLDVQPVSIEGMGVVDLHAGIGQLSGHVVEWAGARYRVIRPSLPDLLAHLKRRAQIVTPKDAMFLLYLAGVGPGSSVAEAGAGSGALTIVLAHTVGTGGRVISYDRRRDFLSIARENVTAAGLEGRVDFRERDVQVNGLDAQDLDAIVLDVPEPWAVLESARNSLRIGGRVAFYTPTYNQLERGVRALRISKFEEIRSVELLERSLHVGEGGTRPEFDMLGHTGFLTGAVRAD